MGRLFEMKLRFLVEQLIDALRNVTVTGLILRPFTSAISFETGPAVQIALQRAVRGLEGMCL
jgi:hypothetical protein